MVVFDVRQRIAQFDELEIVGRNCSYAVLPHQGLDIGTAANLSLAVVRAFENLIDEEEKREIAASLEFCQQPFETPDFSIEVGVAAGHGVTNFDAGVELEERYLEGAGIHRPASIGQGEVNT